MSGASTAAVCQGLPVPPPLFPVWLLEGSQVPSPPPTKGRAHAGAVPSGTPALPAMGEPGTATPLPALSPLLGNRS